jgi:subtilisin family serine protease
MTAWRLRRRIGLGLLATVTAATMMEAGTAFAAAPEGHILDAGAGGTVKDQYIVVMKDGSSDPRAVVGGYGGSVSRVYSHAVHGAAVSMSEDRAKRLAANPAVAYVEQDRKVTMTGVQTSPANWGLDRIDQTSYTRNGVYTYPTKASNVTAYVIDTGIRITHQSFGGRAAYGWDFVDNDAVADDCNGHGTHVAATIGGDAYGVAKGVQLVAVRVLDCEGSGYYSAIMAGIDWVSGHATRPAVVNMSIGGPADSTLDQAVEASIAAGTTYVVAAGNDNVNACTGSPARVGAAITVGATDSTDHRASFSNYGSCLDIFAPGVKILSAYRTSNSATALMSGTSMASPHVAGAAALVLAGNPTATPATVAATLTGKALVNKVAGAGSGSPNRLLYTGGLKTLGVEPAAVPQTCWRRGNATPTYVADLATVYNSVAVARCAGRAYAASKVEVHLTHPSRGDLELTLIAPDGTATRIKSASRTDHTANLNATYTVNLASENRNGTWRLRVRDTVTANAGYLTSWTLAL